MGIIACLIGALIQSAKDLTSKRLAFVADGLTSTFGSFAFALPYYVAALGAAWYFGFESFAVGSSFLFLVVLRAISDSGAEYLKMEAMRRGDISLLTSFMQLSPVFILLLSPLISGDHLSWIGIVGVLIVVSGGLVIIPRADAGGERKASLQGVILSVASALCFAVNSCLDRLAVQQASPLVAGFSMTLMAGIFFSPVLLSRGRTAVLRSQFHFFSLRGLFEIGQMFTKLYALQHLQTAYVASIFRVSILLSVVGGYVLFRERDFGKRLLAGALTMLGVILISVGIYQD
ncbi:MAG: DMT family transporter [Oligoflexia bacterium]|nr:DMT family transporter [Oligoflexia bacterium]